MATICLVACGLFATMFLSGFASDRLIGSRRDLRYYAHNFFYGLLSIPALIFIYGFVYFYPLDASAPRILWGVYYGGLPVAGFLLGHTSGVLLSRYLKERKALRRGSAQVRSIWEEARSRMKQKSK